MGIPQAGIDRLIDRVNDVDREIFWPISRSRSSTQSLVRSATAGTWTTRCRFFVATPVVARSAKKNVTNRHGVKCVVGWIGGMAGTTRRCKLQSALKQGYGNLR